MGLEIKFGVPTNQRQAVARFRVFPLGVLGYYEVFEKTGNNEVHVQALAVSGSERGKGVGSNLLKAVLDQGRSRRFCTLRLEVVDTNLRAKRLYEQIDFKELSAMKLLYPFNRLMGFGSVIKMVYPL